MKLRIWICLGLYSLWLVGGMIRFRETYVSSATEPSFMFVVWWLAWGVVCGGVGGILGRLRGRDLDGMAFGLVLGPIGWIGVLCASDLRPRCPQCLGLISEGASVCRHCRNTLEAY